MSDSKAKMHPIRFSLGSAPDPAGGAYSALPDPYLYLKGLLLRRGRGKGEGRGMGKEREGEERGGKGRDRMGREWKGGRRGRWEHAPIGIIESRRLCGQQLKTASAAT